jgi:glycerol uptake facilitator-like aquaporin
MKMHVNPAVSITFFLYNKINAFMTIGFIASQIAGAVLSLYVFRMFA